MDRGHGSESHPGYSQSGERFAEILLAGRAVGVTDIAPIGTRLALLDAASYPPTVITVEKADGRTVSVRELPKAASLEAGLRGISVDRDLRLYADVGSLGVLLDDEVSSAVPGEAGAFGAAVIKADKRQTGAERHAATVTYRGESFALSVKHALVGLHLVGDAADRSAFAVDEAVTDAAGILRVDRTIHMIGATGREIGLARVPIASSLYIQHGVTMTRKGDVIALLARASSIDIVRLDPRATVPSILPDDSVATVQRVATAAPAGTETVTACRAFLTMYNSAKGYSDNSKSLNTANISGPCPNRTKPRYLTTAKVYSSVSYDWDGFETVSAWNQYMTEGKQAGNIAMTATTGNCGKGVDCSGFVSRVWGLSSHIYTNSLDNYSTHLSGGLHAMLPFDIFLKQGSHVIFFSGWWDDYELTFTSMRPPPRTVGIESYSTSSMRRGWLATTFDRSTTAASNRFPNRRHRRPNHGANHEPISSEDNNGRRQSACSPSTARASARAVDARCVEPGRDRENRPRPRRLPGPRRGCQALGGCQVGDKAVLAGHVTSVPLPLHSQLSVRVCERPATDCDRWSDLDSDGRFVVRDLEPTGYTVTVFLETPSGLVELSAVDVTLAGGQTFQIELDVPALPSIPPA